MAEKYKYLTHEVLLDPAAEVDLVKAPEEIDRLELIILERKRLQDFDADYVTNFLPKSNTRSGV